MDLFISIDAPDIEPRMRRLSFANEPVELRKLNQNVDLSRAQWHGWALRTGGSVLTEDGPAIRIQVPVDVADELTALKEQYSRALDSRVAIGLGIEIQQADRALEAALKQGGDTILPYSEYVEEVLAEEEQNGLTKSVPAMNPGAFAGASHPSAPTVEKPVAAQGEHSEAQDLYDLLNDDEMPPSPESTHSAADFERRLHDHARLQETRDKQAAASSSSEVQAVKQRVAQALQMISNKADTMEQIRQQDPEVYAAMVGLTESVVELARQLRGEQPMQKAEVVDLVKMASSKFKLGHQHDTSSGSPATLVEAMSPAGERLGYAYFIHGEDDETRSPVGPNEMYAMRVEVDPNHRRRGIASAMYDYAEKVVGKRAVPSEDQSADARAFWANRRMKKDELEKAQLPMPHAAAHHHQVLPVGSLVNDHMKVAHGDGSSSWVQMRAGMIRSKDTTGHPISSRNPSGR